MASSDRPDKTTQPAKPFPPPSTDPPELMHGEIFYDPETGLSVLEYRDGTSGEWLLEFSNRVESRLPTAIRRLTAMRLSAVLSQWITNTTNATHATHPNPTKRSRTLAEILAEHPELKDKDR